MSAYTILIKCFPYLVIAAGFINTASRTCIIVLFIQISDLTFSGDGISHFIQLPASHMKHVQRALHLMDLSLQNRFLVCENPAHQACITMIFYLFDLLKI